VQQQQQHLHVAADLVHPTHHVHVVQDHLIPDLHLRDQDHLLDDVMRVENVVEQQTDQYHPVIYVINGRRVVHAVLAIHVNSCMMQNMHVLTHIIV